MGPSESLDISRDCSKNYYDRSRIYYKGARMLAQLFRSKLRAKALGWLFSHPDERFFVRQLEALLDEDPTNISRELARLEKLGLLTCETEGRQKYYRANPDSPIFADLQAIVLKTVGLADVLREALLPVADRIDCAFVYGSAASGELTAGSDVDLLVIGQVNEMDLHKAIVRGERRISRPVNYSLYSHSEFSRRAKKKTGFVARVLAGKKIGILGSPDEV
jgi:predicted nucleotidyltransferase/predicted transcriptional regulator with HTH domain